MDDYWFKPKTHGYGASPANWKGWAATIGVVVVGIGLAYWLLVWPALQGRSPGIGRIVLFLVLDIALIGGFVWLAKAKTEGDWRWRWGEKS